MFTHRTSEDDRQVVPAEHHAPSLQSVAGAPAFVPEALRDYPGKVLYGDALAAQHRAQRRFRAARDDNAQHAPKDRITSADAAVLQAVFALTTTASAVLNDNVYVPQIETLSGLSESTVRRAIRKLAVHGVITWRPHEGRSWSRTRDSGLWVGGRNAVLSVLLPEELNAYLKNGSTIGKVSPVTPSNRETFPFREGQEQDQELRGRSDNEAVVAPTGPTALTPPSRHEHVVEYDYKAPQATHTPGALVTSPHKVPDCDCADSLAEYCQECEGYTRDRWLHVAAEEVSA